MGSASGLKLTWGNYKDGSVNLIRVFETKLIGLQQGELEVRALRRGSQDKGLEAGE